MGRHCFPQSRIDPRRLASSESSDQAGEKVMPNAPLMTRQAVYISWSLGETTPGPAFPCDALCND